MAISRVAEITGLLSPTSSSSSSSTFASAIRNEFLGQQASLIVNRQTSDDSTAEGATADDLASIKTFGITVSQIATAQSVRSDLVSDGDAHGLGSGVSQFRITVGGTNFDFSVDLDSETSQLDVLNAIATEVNGADSSGVYAEVTSDSSTGESYLSLVSHSTGSDEAFALSDQSGTLLADLNLDEAQAADTSEGTGGLLVSAQNAIYSIDNGSDQTSQSNTIDLFDDSVEVTLLDTTNEAAVILSVEAEATSISDAIEDFISSYNDSLEFALDYPGEVTSPLALHLIGAISPFVTQLEQLGIDRDPDTYLLSIDEDQLEEVIDDTRFERLVAALTGPAGLATVALRITDDVIKFSARYLTHPDTGIEQAALAKVERYQYVGRLVNLLI